MKKNLFLLTLLGGFLYVILCAHKVGTATIASLDCTGVIGAGGCGGPTCHGITPSTQISDTVVVIDGSGALVSDYVPGAIYTFRIRGYNNSTAILPKFGYQLTIVQAGTTISVGTFLTTVNIHSTFVSPTLNVSEQSHSLWCSGTGGFGSFYQADVQWIAPSPSAGPLSVSAIINAVDTNGSAGPEDHWPAPGTPVILSEAAPTISGPSSLCAGATAVFGTSISGGTWSSSDPSIATVSSAGLVTAVAAGTVYISYTASTGSTGMYFTVNPVPAAIAGINVVCAGGTSTLTDSTPGGTWLSSNPAIGFVGSFSGVVTGGPSASGTVYISYKIPATGCYRTFPFNVRISASVTGTPAICAGSSSPFTHPFAGGVWYSSDPATATVSSSGMVDAIAPGTSIISYSLGTTWCDAEKTVTVNGAPVAAISGTSTVCLYRTITLTGTPAGGTWSSSDPTTVTVGASSGVITGISNGTATIKYNVSTMCGTDSITSVMTASNAAPCPTGTGDLFAPADELKLFPNPNRGSFSLNVLAAIDEEAHIVVTNVVGAKVRELTIRTNEVNTIAISQPPGIYFLSATTLGAKYFVKIVVE